MGVMGLVNMGVWPLLPCRCGWSGPHQHGGMGGLGLIDMGSMAPCRRGWGGPRQHGRRGPPSTWVAWPTSTGVVNVGGVALIDADDMTLVDVGGVAPLNEIGAPGRGGPC